MTLEEELPQWSQPGKKVSAARLAQLSGLAGREMEAFQKFWPTLPVAQRRRISATLASLAEDNLELDFDDLFRLFLEDADKEVRLQALVGLANTELRTLIPSLVTHLQEDQEETVRAAAARVLGNFALMAHLGKLRPREAAQVQEALVGTIESLEESLEVRRRAVEAIASLDLPEVKPILRQVYESNNRAMRVSALYAMGQNCDVIWLPILFTELKSPNPEMRFEAARACGVVGDETAVPELLPLLQDTDKQVQLAAIAALGAIGGEKAKKALREFLSVEDETLRQAAQEALDKLTFNEDSLRIV